MFSRKPKVNPVGSHPARRTERHPTEGFSCELGPVVDLSTGGMRIESPTRVQAQLGEVRMLKLRTPAGTLALKGQVVRLTRKGLRGYDIGVRFLELKCSTETVLDSLARFGFVAPGIGGGGAFNTAPPPPPIGAASPGHDAPPPKAKPAPDLPDYYMLLGVTPDATEDKIQAAFRMAAWRFHPDVSDDPDGQAKFSLVHEAYKVLRDPHERDAYDRKRAS